MNYKWVNMPARCWWKKQTRKSAALPVFSSGLTGSGVDGRSHWDWFLAGALTEKAACDFSSWCSCNYCGLVRFSWELLRLCFLGSWHYWSHWEFHVLAGSTFPIGWKALSFYFRPKGFLATFIKWQSLGAGKKPYKWLHFSGETEAQKFGLGWTCYVKEHSDVCSLAFHGSLDRYRAAFPWSTSMGIKKVLWHRALASSSHNLEWNEDQAAPGIWMTLQPHLEGRWSCILVLLQMLSSGQQPRPHLGTSEKHRI